jgi:hypothetical protein
MVTNDDINRVHDEVAAFRKEFHDDSQRMWEKLTELSTTQTAISSKCEPCQKEVDINTLAIKGNGKMGLSSRVERLESIRSVVMVVGSSIGTLVLLFLGAISTAYFRHLFP